MYGYVYLTENLITLNCYIGKHESAEFDPTYKGSGTILLRAINKYGWDNFVCQPIAWAESEKELFDLERSWGSKCNVVEDDLFYNLKECGEGGSPKGLYWITNVETGQHKKVLEEDFEYYFNNGWVRNGYTTTPEAVAKRAASNAGKKRSQETKDKISKANKGKPSVCKKSESARQNAINNCRKHNESIQHPVMCVETGVVYKSLNEASKMTGICKSNMCKVCKGKIPKAGGYTWKYVEEH